MRAFRLLVGFLLICLLPACAEDRVFDDWKPMDDAIWKKGETRTFQFDIKDSTSFYDCYTLLRIDQDFPYNNVFLQVDLTMPDRRQQRYLLEYTLADDNGRWMGAGLGDLYDFSMLHPQLKDLRFSKSGTYKISFKQVMRNGDLRGVRAQGISIIKH